MARFFNTSGANKPADHYTVDPLIRLPKIRQLIEDQKYFILHAPRQTGKTTTILAFMEALNREGKYIALYINVEDAQAVRDNVSEANQIFVSTVEDATRQHLPRAYWPSPACSKTSAKSNKFRSYLSNWCRELPKPLVLFIDEADALIGDSMLSLLRQVRAGYAHRPTGFPHSIALIGLRDIRDYSIFSDRANAYILGGSAFNIKDKSLTMSNFSREEARALYAQHTNATGQQFSEAALDKVFEQTNGQPWLVNAIGRELCFEDDKVPDGVTVTAEDVDAAIERIILSRTTHIEHLKDKLTEPRVARIIDRILAGDNKQSMDETKDDDIQFVIDLGLVRRSPQGLVISNPIYQEVVPRELSNVNFQFMSETPKKWYLKPDKKLDIEKVMALFIEFYKENGEMLTDRKLFTEAAHHLTFMSWLQRIVNGGGIIRREYASGLGFIDLVIHFQGEKFVFELKNEGNYKREKALEQVAEYAHRMSVKECFLLVFRRKNDKIEVVGQRETIDYDGLKVHLFWI